MMEQKFTKTEQAWIDGIVKDSTSSGDPFICNISDENGRYHSCIAMYRVHQNLGHELLTIRRDNLQEENLGAITLTKGP